ncbi:unnamed protein product [Adineta steineri]|uniref:G-protein coupled receptors family 1 profile domain-containing protein n=2 Tax=Adineta steineri TaxID=433720 RepID=A0A815PW34_9BILA|nr:unnamed protein product [Adineta steineri]
MTTMESSTSISNELYTDIIRIQVTTVPSDSINTSIIGLQSPIVIFIWFEIIAACLVYGLGFIGNIFSLIIFCSLDEFRRISTGCFFLLTTIANSFHLWTLTTEFLGVYNIYIYSGGFLQCRLNFFVQNVSRAMSTYLAIGIALDRFIRSELPLRSRTICTRRNAIIYTIVNFIIFSIIWSLWLCPTIIKDPITGKCIYNQSPTFYFYLTQVQTPVRFVIVLIIPVIIMITANIRMLQNMRQSHRRVAHQAEMNTTLTAVTPASMNKPIARRMTSLDRMLFYMMVANIGTFIITQIPFHIYTLVRNYYAALDPFTHSLVRAILLIWSSIYFGIAFYLYCFAAPIFRQKFITITRKIIGCLRHRPAREL